MHHQFGRADRAVPRERLREPKGAGGGGEGAFDLGPVGVGGDEALQMRHPLARADHRRPDDPSGAEDEAVIRLGAAL